MEPPGQQQTQPAFSTAPPLRRGARVLRVLLRRVLPGLLGLYLGLIALLYFAQAALLFTGAQTRGQPAARVDPPGGTELLHLSTKAGTPVTALFGPALTRAGEPRTDGARCPTILLFYGSGGWLSQSV